MLGLVHATVYAACIDPKPREYAGRSAVQPAPAHKQQPQVKVLLWPAASFSHTSRPPSPCPDHRLALRCGAEQWVHALWRPTPGAAVNLAVGSYCNRPWSLRWI